MAVILYIVKCYIIFLLLLLEFLSVCIAGTLCTGNSLFVLKVSTKVNFTPVHLVLDCPGAYHTEFISSQMLFNRTNDNAHTHQQFPRWYFYCCVQGIQTAPVSVTVHLAHRVSPQMFLWVCHVIEGNGSDGNELPKQPWHRLHVPRESQWNGIF